MVFLPYTRERYAKGWVELNIFFESLSILIPEYPIDLKKQERKKIPSSYPLGSAS